MKWAILALAIWLGVGLIAEGYAGNKSQDINGVKLVRVYDGDTFFVDIPSWPRIIGEEIGIRIANVDTPEIRGSKCSAEHSLAIEAREYVKRELFSAKHIELTKLKRGKYFRIVATVLIDGQNLANKLVEHGYAVKYYGGKKTKDWCEGR
jgi:endonuclease YncB( thermonuclease family)